MVIEPGVADAAPNVTDPADDVAAYTQDESLAPTVTLKVSPVAKSAGLRKPKTTTLKVGDADKVPVIAALIVKVDIVAVPKVLASQPVSSLQATMISVSAAPLVAVIVRAVPTDDRNDSKLAEDVTSNK